MIFGLSPDEWKWKQKTNKLFIRLGLSLIISNFSKCQFVVVSWYFLLFLLECTLYSSIFKVAFELLPFEFFFYSDLLHPRLASLSRFRFQSFRRKANLVWRTELLRPNQQQLNVNSQCRGERLCAQTCTTWFALCMDWFRRLIQRRWPLWMGWWHVQIIYKLNYGEPNNMGPYGSDENCTEFYSSDGGWNDLNCAYNNKTYVCGKKLNP